MENLVQWLKMSVKAGAYAGFLRGVGGNYEISRILDIHAAKLRAFVSGVWGHAPQENF